MPPPQYVFNGVRVADFLTDPANKKYNLQLAINGNLWDGTVTMTPPPPTGLQPQGLVIANGVVYVPPLNSIGGDGFSHKTALVTTGAGQASIVETDAAGFDPTSYQNAITGTGLLLNVQFGKVVNVSGQFLGPAPSGRAARTAVGLSQDHRYLYLVAIDGHENLKLGATLFEAGEWQRAFGGVIGINMDGGGSTTMVIPDGKGGATQLSDTDDSGSNTDPNKERYVAVQLGIGLK
jgi:exopolysaccharide biosynthesis protein